MGSLTRKAIEHPLLLAFVAGIAAHIAVFRRGEWHMQAPLLAMAFSGTFLVGWIHDLSFDVTEVHCTRLVCAFYIGLFSSVISYRLFFHKLRHFPGPVGARVSKLWHMFHCLDSRQHQYLHRLYKEYGPFVRTGPRELMIVRPDVFDLVDSPRSQSHKTDWYDLLRPAKAVISERDPEAHSKRRKLWDKALNSTSLAEYKPVIVDHVNALLDNIYDAASNRKHVQANDIFYWFAFDVVAHLALGKSFDMQKERKWHRSTLQLRSGMGLLGIASPVPWLARIAFAYLRSIPVVKNWFALQSFLKIKMIERVKRGMMGKDIAQHFIESAECGGWTDEDWQWLYGDGMNVVIAGSETTAGTITFLFSQLAKDEGLAARLYNEVGSIDPSDLEALRNAQLLNGIINETLRLYPALPSAVYRETLPGGLMVGDTWVPEDIKIIAPRYSVGRLEDAFADPESFIPERWTDRPELVHYSKAFAPFATGRYSCVGKQLALNEIRIVTASILQKFRVCLAPGENGTAILREMKDQMAMFPGPLRLTFEIRE